MASVGASGGYWAPVEVARSLNQQSIFRRWLEGFAAIRGTVFLLLLSPIIYLSLLAAGALGRCMKRREALTVPDFSGTRQAPALWRPPASIVIPNWNGRDLLEKYLPSVISACDFDLGDELIVVDNASLDGSAEWIHRHHPEVRLIRLATNKGFGGGSNAGIHAARNRYVVLLNSDMRVEANFLAPLLAPFHDPDVFAVAAQILFSDPRKRREESGLTQAYWRRGEIALGHDLNADVSTLYPCFYPGGGSSAFDRKKLLSLGGFDHLYRPFYLEDTDLGWEAWKRGWKVLYASNSLVYHEHRGTIGKRFSASYVETVIEKNRILFHWKHVLHPGKLASYFVRLITRTTVNLAGGQTPRGVSGRAACLALAQLPEVLRRRWQSARHARRGDMEALGLHQPDVFHDRFLHAYPRSGPQSERLQILFLSPYPIYPPHHGGATLMYQTLAHLTELADVHLVVMLEAESEREAHLEQAHRFASMHTVVRPPATASNRFGLLPKAVREFAIPDLHTLLDRLILENAIDVLQVEYTQLAQYAKPYRRVVTSLFEHDIYFQSVGRSLRAARGVDAFRIALEYLRAIHYELTTLKQMDYIQVCTETNRRYLERYSPALAARTDATLRAGIDISSFGNGTSSRDRDTLLFVGNFRHPPNREGLQWLLSEVMPAVIGKRPSARLRIVGPNPQLLSLHSPLPDWLTILGPVEDVRPHLEQCALFVCPVLTGSGVRVKLLEAFAAGIPVVATSIGAEGLAGPGARVCAVADSPEAFAAEVLRLLNQPEAGLKVAGDARAMVEADWDARKNTRRLVARYHELLKRKAEQPSQSAAEHPRSIPDLPL